MGFEHRYNEPTDFGGSGFDVTLEGVIELGEIRDYSERAAAGEADTIEWQYDDPEGLFDPLPFRYGYVTQSACPAGDRRVWTGYLGAQQWSRGDEGTELFPIGRGRRWRITLTEVNSYLRRRMFIASDSPERPEDELSTDRLAWAFTTRAFGRIHDNGLIDIPAKPMAKKSYLGLFAADLLNDVMEVTGTNGFLYFDGTAVQLSLGLFDFDTSTLYTGDMRISNDPADVEGDETGNTFYPNPGSTKGTRNPERIAAGVGVLWGDNQLTYDYDATIGELYADQDQLAPTTAVDTLPQAEDLRDQYMADHRSQEEVVEVDLIVPAAKMNTVKRGQRIQAKFVEGPGWEAFRWCRVTNKVFSVPENKSEDMVELHLELRPQKPLPGGFLIAFVTASGGVPHGAMPLDLSANPWTVAAWSGDFADPAQFPGPGVDQSMGIWYRDVVPGEGAGVLTMKAYSGASRCAAWVCEVAGADSATISVVSGTDTVGSGVFPNGCVGADITISAAPGSASVLFGGFALQKVAYGGGTVLVADAGSTQLISANQVNSSPLNNQPDTRPPWSWIGYITGTGALSLGATDNDVPNPNNYNLMGRGYAALLMETPTAFSVVQGPVFGGPALPGQPFTVTLPSPPTP